MQKKDNSKKDVPNKQEKAGFLLSVLSTIWREWRTLIYLNFTMDLFAVFPALFIMGVSLEWPMAVIYVLIALSAASILSLPAALCAANRITICMVRGESFFFNHDFWKAFKENYGKALAGGIFYFVILALLGYSAYIAMLMFSQGTLFYVTFAIALSGFIVFLIGSFYFWPMLALIDLKTGPILKNSLLIVPAGWKRSLFALLITVIFTVILCLFSVGTLLFLLGIFFLALFILNINFALYPVISRLVILRESPKPTGTVIKQIDGKELRWDETEEKAEKEDVSEAEEAGSGKETD